MAAGAGGSEKMGATARSKKKRRTLDGVKKSSTAKPTQNATMEQPDRPNSKRGGLGETKMVEHLSIPSTSVASTQTAQQDM
eukprot:567063-Rhodomonas_salina.1